MSQLSRIATMYIIVCITYVHCRARLVACTNIVMQVYSLSEKFVTVFRICVAGVALYYFAARPSGGRRHCSLSRFGAGCPLDLSRTRGKEEVVVTPRGARVCKEESCGRTRLRGQHHLTECLSVFMHFLVFSVSVCTSRFVCVCVCVCFVLFCSVAMFRQNVSVRSISSFVFHRGGFRFASRLVKHGGRWTHPRDCCDSCKGWRIREWKGADGDPPRP